MYVYMYLYIYIYTHTRVLAYVMLVYICCMLCVIVVYCVFGVCIVVICILLLFGLRSQQFGKPRKYAFQNWIGRVEKGRCSYTPQQEAQPGPKVSQCLRHGGKLGGTTCLTLLVRYGPICFLRNYLSTTAN